MPRAKVLRGFCIGVGNDAEVGQEVDLAPELYKQMLRQEYIEPIPDAPAPAEAPADLLGGGKPKAKPAPSKTPSNA